MATLDRRRIANLERQQIQCECSGGLIIRFVGEQLSESRPCLLHGEARVIDWPLAKSKLDLGSDAELR